VNEWEKVETSIKFFSYSS